MEKNVTPASRPNTSRKAILWLILIITSFTLGYLTSTIKHHISSKQGVPQNESNFYIPQTKAEPTPSETESSSGSGLTVVNFNWEPGVYGSRCLAGTVKNNSDKEYSYVRVDFNLYDNSGAQVGWTDASIGNLEPHGTWKFKTNIVTDEKATQAKLKEIVAQ